MKVGDLITWRNPRERGKSEFKGYGLVAKVVVSFQSEGD